MAMTTVLLFYPAAEAEVVTGMLEVWFQESDVEVGSDTLHGINPGSFFHSCVVVFLSVCPVGTTR